MFVFLQRACAETITLDQAMNIAIMNNPQLRAVQSKLGISEAQIITANTRLNPSLLSDNGVAEKTYRLGIEQTFELGGKRKKRTALANSNKDIVSIEILTALLDLRSDVRSAYIQLYNAQQRYNTANEVLANANKLLDVAMKREKAGQIAGLDVLQAEITTLTAKNELQRSQLGKNKAFNELNAILGQALLYDVALSAPSLLVEFADAKSIQKERDDCVLFKLLQLAFATRPEIKNIYKNIEASNRQIEVARSKIIPDLSLTAGPDMVLAGGEDSNSIDKGVFVMANVDIPVFNRQRGPINEAIARKCQYEKELEATKNRITLEVKNAYSEIISNAESIRIYENELMPKADEVVQKSRRSFEEGKSTILIPLAAQQAYINTKFGYIMMKNDYQQAVSDLERALGICQ